MVVDTLFNQTDSTAMSMAPAATPTLRAPTPESLALNLNIHLHMFFVDGACMFEDEQPRFHRVAAPSAKPNSNACSAPSPPVPCKSRFLSTTVGHLMQPASPCNRLGCAIGFGAVEQCVPHVLVSELESYSQRAVRRTVLSQYTLRTSSNWLAIS